MPSTRILYRLLYTAVVDLLQHHLIFCPQSSPLIAGPGLCQRGSPGKTCKPPSAAAGRLQAAEPLLASPPGRPPYARAGLPRARSAAGRAGGPTGGHQVRRRNRKASMLQLSLSACQHLRCKLSTESSPYGGVSPRAERLIRLLTPTQAPSPLQI